MSINLSQETSYLSITNFLKNYDADKCLGNTLLMHECEDVSNLDPGHANKTLRF